MTEATERASMDHHKKGERRRQKKVQKSFFYRRKDTIHRILLVLREYIFSKHRVWKKKKIT
jgi:hypothetical protein